MTINGTISQQRLRGLMQDASAAARLAGDRLLELYRVGDYSISSKPDSTPLTTADMEASQMIEAALGQLTPRFPVLSEESPTIPFDRRRVWQTYWLVDPLDGTTEFINGSGEFSVNIALIHAGKPLLGVIYAPVTGITYFACSRDGAHKRDGSGTPSILRVRAVPEQGLTIARSRSRRTSHALSRYLAQLGHYEEIALGSSLKSCLVAEGRADIYIGMGPTSEWDTAAAQCIVEEAGGRITDTRMQALRYNTRESLLNPHFLVFGDPSRDWSAYLAPGV